MRNSTSTKLIVALLAFVLAFNVGVFAQADGDDVGMVFDFVDAPNELEDEVAVDFGISDGLELPALEEDAEIMAVNNGQVVAPGRVIEYNGRTYRVIGQQNMMTALGDGSFSSMPSPYSTNSDRNVSPDGTFISTNDGTIVTNDGHDAPGCFEFTGGIVIWRCGASTFSSDKYYVYSGWFKFDKNADIVNGERKLAGTTDVDTHSVHYNEIGRKIEKTGDWQQDFCVFNGNDDYRFLYLQYTGSGAIRLDDMMIYEVEPIPTFTIEGSPLLEETDTWDVYTDYIPKSGVDYNYVIKYQSNVTKSSNLNGVLILFKDNKLYKISQSTAGMRTAVITDAGELVSGEGAIPIPFTIDSGEDISRYSCLGYICDGDDPFNILGAASDSYPKLFTGAQQ